jgi:Fe-S-cluster containining protein
MMKLRVLADARFTCQCCAQCCRGWHVELLAGESERITKLKWPAGDPLERSPAMFQHAGKVYLPHQVDGSCVFLNTTSGLCRIHEQFGLETKPLGCQLYPFRIVPTFAGEASVTFRYDCPTVRENRGAPMLESLVELKRFEKQLVLPENFDRSVMGSFDEPQIEAVCDFVGTLLGGFDRNEDRALFISIVCDWLGEIAPQKLDRAALAGAFLELKKRVQSAVAAPARRPGLIHRLAFRTLLGIYLRRDEDVLNGHASRFTRLISMFCFVLGFGSFRGLGVSHPVGKLSRAGWFASTIPAPSVDVSALHWHMIRAKLESFQFMGSANPGHNFLSGLRSLALLYPLMLAAAKYRAGNRGSASIDSSDIDYAVAAIEHSFGRGAMLRLPFARSLETFLLETSAFGRLVRTI